MTRCAFQLLATIAVAACAVPTDRSEEYRVVLDSVPELFASDTVQLVARLVGSDGKEVPAARIEFSSGDPAVALVTRDGRMVAAGGGTVQVTARAPALANARAGQVAVRVHGAVEIDSVRPTAVRYGEALRVYGVGLNPAGGAAAVRIEGQDAPITGFTPADPAQPDAFGVLEAIVTAPVGLGQGGTTGVAQLQATIIVANARGGASLVTPLAVEMRDRFEPNDSTPADLGVVTSRLELTGLAFDNYPAGSTQIPVDWYSFTTTAPGDWTITARSTQGWVREPRLELVSGPMTFTESGFYTGFLVNDPAAAALGTQAMCRGFANALTDPLSWPGLEFLADYVASFVASEWGDAPVVRLPVRNLPAGTHHLLLGTARQPELMPWGPGFQPPSFVSFLLATPQSPSATQEAVRYDLVIEPGVHTPVAPDAYEGNDFCTDAPTLLTLDSTAIADSTINLSYDSELDWDWFRIKGQVTGRLYMSATPTSLPAPPRMRVYRPTPGMTGPVDRMTTIATTQFGDLYSDIDYLAGIPIDTLEYYLVGVPNDRGDDTQGSPGTYRLTFWWQPGPIPAPPVPAAARDPRGADRLRGGYKLAPGVTLPPR